GGDEVDTTEYKDAQISSMSLSHDSISALANTKFTIDQLNGLIYNADSLPYGTKVGKVICTLTYSLSYVDGTMVVEGAKPDSIWWNGSDSLDFSVPLYFRVTAYDGKTTKSYKAWVNLHQVNPDTAIWTPYASTGIKPDEMKVLPYHLASAASGEEDVYIMYAKTGDKLQAFYAPRKQVGHWTEEPLVGLPAKANLQQVCAMGDTLYAPTTDGKLYYSGNGFQWAEDTSAPQIKALMGVVDSGYTTPQPLLSAVIEEGGSLRFARRDLEGAWTEGQALPDSFPLSGFGSIGYERLGYAYLMVVAGKDAGQAALNTTWATGDALQWAQMNDPNMQYFSKREGPVLTYYDNDFYLIGGLGTDGEAKKDVYRSLDSGISWQVADTMLYLPKAYPATGYASVAVDADNYMFVFGGKTSKAAKHTDAIWRGRITRLGFGKDN
ncbi:MAG: DUF6242 domain-containing protein, partial [Tannerella sp.]|nr:DUF6242 domain-containing protein [Tannerella sp.]